MKFKSILAAIAFLPLASAYADDCPTLLEKVERAEGQVSYAEDGYNTAQRRVRGAQVSIDRFSEAMARDKEAGDTKAYNLAVRKYNAAVDNMKMRRAEYQQKSNEYQASIDRFNELVDKFNARCATN
ncbi:hypothetical protein L2750_07460 [Shewanella submarina]|uniref:Uncharacterized protein n=1 Tax=Shewanella submarina TaxID=2016376 RepID=A0ABV7G7Y2_9GAMM|nr:hypothetical protein [Shewanella submarina]MCL1036989.1 hypothetical protein [Shewanella submarina]